MAEPTSGADRKEKPDAAPAKRKWGLLVVLVAAPLLLAAGGGTAVFLVPGVGTFAKNMLHGAPPPADASHPNFLSLPEMTITLQNGGRPRQLRIGVSLEFAKIPDGSKPEDILTPRLYDQLVTYLRTLRDADLEGGVALDRLRGDLYRRLTLLLGDGVVRDVLITSLVVA